MSHKRSGRFYEMQLFVFYKTMNIPTPGRIRVTEHTDSMRARIF
nr:hypothetical protein [Klebsiella michiganensis]